MPQNTVARETRPNDAILVSTTIPCIFDLEPTPFDGTAFTELIDVRSWARLGGQIRPSKTRLIQAKVLGSAWFCSSEFGIFSGSIGRMGKI
jgi:hypothetical protein